MSFDWTISIGNILTILGFVVGGLLAASAIRVDIVRTSDRLNDVEAELKKMAAAMETLARQDERMKYFERRLAMIEEGHCPACSARAPAGE